MKVGSENTCGHEGYAKKQEWQSKAKIMAKSKNGKKPKESFLEPTLLTILHTTQGIDNQREE